MTDSKNHMAAMKKRNIQIPWYKQIYNAVEGFLQFVFRLVTVVLLFLCFFTVFAITAILLKIFGKKLMPAYEKDSVTYWEEKDVIDLSPDQIAKES